MATYYPVIITAALFIAIILDDILQENNTGVPIHGLEGLVCVGLMIILSLRDSEIISWGLLVLIVVIFSVAYYFGRSKSSSVPSLTSIVKPVMSCPVQGVTASPSIIGTPNMSSISPETISQFTPITACGT